MKNNKEPNYKIDDSKYAKNSEKSHKLRLVGNELFNKKMYEEALRMYTQSIIQAPFHHEETNEELSLGFGNRSAVHFYRKQYTECLEDIRLALKFGYPGESVDKLMRRKDKCLDEICKTKAVYANENGSESKEIVKILSPSVEIFINDGGRGLRAKKPIKKGDMILEEKPYVMTLKKSKFDSFCYHCFRLLPEYRAFPCQNCTQVLFCSYDCAKSSWEEYHSIECKSMDVFLLNESFQYPPIMTLHILAKVGLNTVIKTAKKSKDDYVTDGYEAAYSLVEHHDDENNYKPIAELILSFLKKKGEVGVLWKKEEEILIQEICSLMRKIQVNAIEINSKDFKTESKLEDIKTISVQDIGCGLYLTFRFLNHSCYPNVGTGYFNGNSIMVKAVRDINEGEELFICYGAHHKWQTTSERQKLLKESYYFDCKCDACSNNLQPVNKAFLCPKCKGPVICELNEIICLKCNLKNHLDLETLLAEAGPCFKLSEFAYKYMESGHEDQLMIAEKTFLEAYNLLSSILYPMHNELGKLLEKQRLCYKLSKSWSKAVRSAEKHFLVIKSGTDQLDLATLNALLKLIDALRLFIKHNPSDEKMKQKLDKYLKEAIQLRSLFIHSSTKLYKEIGSVLHNESV